MFLSIIYYFKKIKMTSTIKNENDQFAINLVKYQTRYTIQSEFNKQLLGILKNIEKKYWDRLEKIWYLPISSLDYFYKEVNKIPNFSIYEKTKIPSAVIWFDKSNTFKITFSGFIGVDAFGKFKQLNNFKYANRAILLPIEMLDIINKR